MAISPALFGQFATKLGVELPTQEPPIELPTVDVPRYAAANDVGGAKEQRGMPYGGRRNASGQPIDVEPRASVIAPPQPTASGPMVPVYNATGQQVGEKPANAPPLFNFTLGPSAATQAAGGPIETIGPDRGKREPEKKRAEEAGEVAGLTQTTSGFAQATPTFAPPVYHPGGFDAGRVPFRPGTIKREQDLFDQEKQNADNAARAQVTANLVVAARQQQDADEYAVLQAQHAQKEQERQAYVSDQRAKAAQYLDDVTKSRIDPQRLFSNADTGTRLSIALGGMLGGILQGIHGGGSNSFMDNVNRAIDRDMDAQKEDLATKKFRAQGAQNMLGELRAQYGDERMAENVLKQGMLTHQKMQLESIMQREQNPQILARAEQAGTALDMQKNQLQMQLDQMAHYNAYTTGGAANDNGKKFLVKVGDRTVAVPNEILQNKLIEKSGLVSNIRANVQKAIALRKGASSTELLNPLSSVRKQLASLKAETAVLNTVAKGQGAMSKGDQQVSDDSIGAMEGFLSNNDDVLRAFDSRLGAQLERDVKASGGEDVQTGYKYNARGELVPDSAYVGKEERPAPAMPKPLAGGR